MRMTLAGLPTTTGVIGHIPVDQRIGTDDGVFSDGNAGKNRRIGADPGAFFDADIRDGQNIAFIKIMIVCDQRAVERNAHNRLQS